MSFQQKATVLASVAMATDFEHKLDLPNEFYKPVKYFKQIHFELILVLHFFP